MLTLWLFATRLFSVSLAYRYVGNDYTSGTNNAPSVDINCSKFLPSLMQVKFLLASLIKLFFFFYLIKWYGFLKETWWAAIGELSSFTAVQYFILKGSHSCSQQAHTVSHFKPISNNTPVQLGQMPQTMGAPHRVISQSSFFSTKRILKGKKSNPIILPFFSCILIKSCLCNNLLM